MFAACSIFVSLALTGSIAGQAWRNIPDQIHEGWPAATYDAARARVVAVIVGRAGLLETWEHLGDAWVLRAAGVAGVSAPFPGCTLAFDPQAAQVLAFGGGFEGGPASDQSWLWDGERWQLQPLATRPPARTGQAMATDARSGRILMFGGDGASGELGDTWEWNAGAWGLRASAGPAPRSHSGLAVDTVRGRVVLYGGGTNLRAMQDTWEWDGSAWTQVATPTSPNAGGGLATFDPVQARVILVTFGLVGQRPQWVTWAFDGRSWTQAAATIEPNAFYAIMFDDRRQGIVALARMPHPYGLGVADWTGAGWAGRPTQAGPPLPWSRPSPNPLHLAYDSVRREVVAVETFAAVAGPARTWTWRGDRWREVASGTFASRDGVGLAFDSARGQTILFGGRDVAGRLLDETWAWNGSAWAQLASATRPPGAVRHAMTFDSARTRVVMHDESTWEWDGANWRVVASGTQVRPPRSDGAAMAFDARRLRCVLFASLAAETWEWNGSVWTRAVTPNVPPVRADHSMAWDTGTGDVVLFGGTDSMGNPLNDVWRFDGSDWRQQPLSPGPQGGVATFDEARGNLVVRGPNDGAAVGTWVLTAQPAAVAGLGSRCLVRPSPTLVARGLPAPSERAFGFDLLHGPANAPGALLLAAAPAAFAVGPCLGYITAPFADVPVLTGTSGFAAVSVAVPNVAWVRGVTFYAQAALVTAAGIGTSQGLRLTVGD